MGTKPKCEMPGCDQDRKGHGMCPAHLRRWNKGLRGAELGAPIRPRLPKVCTIRGCEAAPLAREMCDGHYSRWQDGKRGEELNKPIRIRRHPAGTENIYTDGYVFIKLDDGTWERKHRFVMEQELGRSLLPQEEIHHKNGDRADNRLENLELWSTSQPYGQRVTDKVDWGIELLTKYKALPNSTINQLRRNSGSLAAFLDASSSSVSNAGGDNVEFDGSNNAAQRVPRHKQPSLICTIKGCDKPTLARELCSHHYRRWRQGERGEVLEQVIAKRTPLEPGTAVCNIEGCGKQVKSNNMCSMHCERRRRGERGATLERPPVTDWTWEPCILEGCEKPASPGKMCKMHKSRLRRGKQEEELLAPPTRRWQRSVCEVDGCQKIPKAKNLCDAHYMRSRNGDENEQLARPMRDRDSPIGAKRTENGYVYIKVAGVRRWAREHRFVMETRLGRQLLENEEVHHKNGDKLDNRLENLELWSHSQPPGQRVTDKLAWATDFLVGYGVMTEQQKAKLRVTKIA